MSGGTKGYVKKDDLILVDYVTIPAVPKRSAKAPPGSNENKGSKTEVTRDYGHAVSDSLRSQRGNLNEADDQPRRNPDLHRHNRHRRLNPQPPLSSLVAPGASSQ